MRKGNREITAIDEIISVMEKCDVCRIALNNGDYPYILPLSFGMDYKGEKLTLYFHSALEGMKLDLIKKDNRAAFEMDCEGELEYHREKGYCTYNYASVIGMGKITFVEKDEEKIYCLEKLMEHYHSGEKAPFSKAALPRTTVYKLEVETITGKRKVSLKSVK